MRAARLLPVALLLLALAAAAPATAATGAAPARAAKAKRCHGARAVVGGKRTCLRRNRRCRAAFRDDYLLAGFVCVRRRVHHHRRLVLRRASRRAVRQGRVITLPRSGRPTFHQALWLFDTLVHPLPGVRTPRGAVGRAQDGTIALQWAWHYRKRLTRAQRRVVDRELRPAHASAAKTDPFAQIVADALPRLQAHGVKFTHPVIVQQEKKPNGTAGADAWPQWLAKEGNACRVRVFPNGRAAALPERRMIVLHELMHCAMAELSPTLTQWGAIPPYLGEGYSEWAAERVSVEWLGSSAYRTTWWPVWLDSSTLGLRTRSYDALGFWSLIEHEGVDTWGLLPQLVKGANTGDTTKPYVAAKFASPPTMESDWGPSLATHSPLAPRWDLNGPAMPKRHEPDPTIDEGTIKGKAVQAGGAFETRADLQADVIAVQGSPNIQGWFRDADGTEREIKGDIERFCTVEDGCECPDGTVLPYEKIPTGDARFGYADLIDDGALVVAGESIEEHCKPTKPRGIEVAGANDVTLANFTKGTCGVKKGVFTAHATDRGYTLDLRIESWDGYDKHYVLAYAGTDPTFTVKGPGGPYSNVFHPPQYPPAGGLVVFNKKGTRMSAGFITAFTQDYAGGIRLGPGAMDCRKPRK